MHHYGTRGCIIYTWGSEFFSLLSRVEETDGFLYSKIASSLRSIFFNSSHSYTVMDLISGVKISTLLVLSKEGTLSNYSCIHAAFYLIRQAEKLSWWRPARDEWIDCFAAACILAPDGPACLTPHEPPGIYILKSSWFLLADKAVLIPLSMQKKQKRTSWDWGDFPLTCGSECEPSKNISQPQEA